MARRTVTITQLRYYKRNSRKPDKYLDVASLPDNSDLLHLIYAVWNGLERNTLRDRERQRYCEPESRIAKGRAVAMTAMVGVYGDPASIRDVDSGTERMSHAGDLTNSFPLRTVALVPKMGTSAFLFIEHVTGVIFGQRFLDELKLVWSQRFPEYTLQAETLTRPDAWLANARLEAVTAEVYKHDLPLEEKGKSSTVGILTTVLEPPKGAGALPRALLTKLSNGKAKRAKLLGLREEPDEVKVKLGDGEQSRTFVLGKDRTPPVRILVSDYGDPMLSQKGFRAWCSKEAAGHFNTLGVDWEQSFLDGKWSVETLALKSVVDRGN